MESCARRIALTGGIATGKSHCLAALVGCGASVIDADTLARDSVAPGSPGLAAVVARFGRQVLRADGTLNRAALGHRIFAAPDERTALEAIIHPAVYDRVARWFGALAVPAGVADIPLLYETGRQTDFDLVIVAACEPEQQLARLMARNQMSEADARARIAAQWPIARKAALADHVIDTSGTVEQTQERTRAVWASIS
ncbi:MAG: dephospho-CoA kinase [Acidobacteria bacterium]|jgi:dephospho-CoA kinase|nr:dephospho-CoA kinase [Acidobacteriota bacterium]